MGSLQRIALGLLEPPSPGRTWRVTSPLTLTHHLQAGTQKPGTFASTWGEKNSTVAFTFQSFPWAQAEIGALLEIHTLPFPVLTNGAAI